MLLCTGKSNTEHWAVFNKFNTIIEFFSSWKHGLYFLCLSFILPTCFPFVHCQGPLCSFTSWNASLRTDAFSCFLFCPIFAFNWLARFSSTPADSWALEILFPAYHVLNLLYWGAKQAPPLCFLLSSENASFLTDQCIPSYCFSYSLRKITE